MSSCASAGWVKAAALFAGLARQLVLLSVAVVAGVTCQCLAGVAGQL
jgi:hypothetical protein